MSNGFSSMVFTTEGLNLLAKAQAGTELKFTRIAVGDGILNGQDATKFTHLINEVMSLNISELLNGGSGSATIGTVLSNANLDTGFYWREIGVFATDPQLGEILYGYDNANGGEIYIPDKSTNIFTAPINIGVFISNAATVTAVIDSSLVFAKMNDVDSLSNLVTTLQNSVSNLAKVATSGSYTDLSSKPTIPAVPLFETVSSNIKMNGTAAAGNSGKIADAAHVHPTEIQAARVLSMGGMI